MPSGLKLVRWLGVVATVLLMLHHNDVSIGQKFDVMMTKHNFKQKKTTEKQDKALCHFELT